MSDLRFPIGHSAATRVGGGVSGDASSVTLVDPVTGAGIFTPNTDPLNVSIDALTGLPAPVGTDMGAGAFVRSAWKRLVLNGDFALPPARTDWPINSDRSSAWYNPLPGFTFTDNSNGAIVLWWVPDTGSGSGGALLWNIGPGAAGDEAYIEQLVPIRSTRSRNNSIQAFSGWFNGTNDANPKAYHEAQPIKSDAVTTTGTALTKTGGFNVLVTDNDLWFAGTANMVLPADCGRVRLRVGVKRDTGAVGSSYSIQTDEVSLVESAGETQWPDLLTPANAPFRANYQDGIFVLWGGATNYFGIYGPAFATPKIAIANAYLELGSFLQVPELATPATPSSGVRIYAKSDNALYALNDAGVEIALGGGGTGMRLVDVQYAACSSDFGLTSTTAADVTGATLTMTAVAGDTFLVTAVMDVQTTVAGTSKNALGTMVANGVTQSGTVVKSLNAIERAGAAQQWIVTGLAAGSRIFKLQGAVNSLAATAATAFIKATHTTIIVWQFR